MQQKEKKNNQLVAALSNEIEKIGFAVMPGGPMRQHKMNKRFYLIREEVENA